MGKTCFLLYSFIPLYWFPMTQEVFKRDMGQKGQHMIKVLLFVWYLSDICLLTATDGCFVFDEEVCEVELIAPNLWDSVSVDESSLLKYERSIDVVLVTKVNNTKYKIRNDNTKYKKVILQNDNKKYKIIVIQNTKYEGGGLMWCSWWRWMIPWFAEAAAKGNQGMPVFSEHLKFYRIWMVF